MTRAYSEYYLDETMSNMGSMLDYAVNSCGEDLTLFYARFLTSGIAEQIGRGNPRYLCGLSGTELAMKAASLTGEPLPENETFVDMGSPEYWAGWTLAYIQWYLNVGFDTLETIGAGIREIYSRYQTLHEADLSKAADFALYKLNAFRMRHNPVKEARRAMRLTQRQLAELSGVSLRSIRAYEQGQLDTAGAGAGSLRDLAGVLGCRIERLLI